MPPKRTAALKGGSTVQRKAMKRPAQPDVEQDINEYHERRRRNNIAVKKSRAKSRAHAQMTTIKVEELRHENTSLEAKVNVLSKELDLLKDLLVLRAGTSRADAGSSGTCEDTVTSETSTTADSSVAAADPEVIRQDHGYVSPVHRTRKPR